MRGVSGRGGARERDREREREREHEQRREEECFYGVLIEIVHPTSIFLDKLFGCVCVGGGGSTYHLIIDVCVCLGKGLFI